jgi:hypothetical protein
MCSTQDFRIKKIIFCFSNLGMHRKSLEAAETLKISEDNNSDKEEETRTEASESSMRSLSHNHTKLHQSPSTIMEHGNINNNNKNLNPSSNSSIKSSISPAGSSMISPQSLSSSSTPPPSLATTMHHLSPSNSNTKKPMSLKDDYYTGSSQPNTSYYPDADPELFRWVDYRHPTVSYIR